MDDAVTLRPDISCTLYQGDVGEIQSKIDAWTKEAVATRQNAQVLGDQASKYRNDPDPGMRTLAETAQKDGNAESEALLDHIARAQTLLDNMNSYAQLCDSYKTSMIKCLQNPAGDRCEGGAIASDARQVKSTIQAIKDATEKMDPKW
jgi:hypothetical protein